MRSLTRALTVALVAAGLTGCGGWYDDDDCSAPPPRPPVVRPSNARQPKPVKPTIRQWRGDRPRNYKTPKPTRYPGYPGTYPHGIYPFGYGRAHGCNAPEGSPIQ